MQHRMAKELADHLNREIRWSCPEGMGTYLESSGWLLVGCAFKEGEMRVRFKRDDALPGQRGTERVLVLRPTSWRRADGD